MLVKRAFSVMRVALKMVKILGFRELAYSIWCTQKVGSQEIKMLAC